MNILCYFELSLALETERFQRLLDRVYEKPHDYEYYSDDEKYVDESLASKGITIIYHDSRKKKVKLRVILNWKREESPSDEKILKSLHKLEEHLDDYFDSKYGLDDFKLSKMGLVTDIDVHERKNVTDYLKVIRSVGRVKGFSPSSDDRLDRGSSFYWEGNSNGMGFAIFDLQEHVKNRMLESEAKRKQLEPVEEKARGVLRTEVWLTSSRAFQNFTDETAVLNQMAGLLKHSKEIFLKTMARIIPFGDFYKKYKAIEIIQKNVTDAALRRRMIRLLTLIPEKKSLLLAQKTLNCRRIDEVMFEFYSINLSPVTLSKRHDVKHLENLYEFLDTNHP